MRTSVSASSSSVCPGGTTTMSPLPGGSSPPQVYTDDQRSMYQNSQQSEGLYRDEAVRHLNQPLLISNSSVTSSIFYMQGILQLFSSYCIQCKSKRVGLFTIKAEPYFCNKTSTLALTEGLCSPVTHTNMPLERSVLSLFILQTLPAIFTSMR